MRSADDSSAVDRRLNIVESGEYCQRVVVTPAAAAEMLLVNGAPYRGVVEVRRGRTGVTAVNIVYLEDYVRGVVPYEMSPTAFPEIEALKAQAVAARTYVLHNLGQYESQGYDLCATATCQVYRGQSGEHPLTDRAVEETRHIIITHAGNPINALFTSTCGGHTEDVENVFNGQKVAYLRGVPCQTERSSWRVIRSLAPESRLSGDDARDAALLETMGIARFDAETAWARTVKPEDVEAWTSRLMDALGRDGCAPQAKHASSRRGDLLSRLMNRLCWRERAVRLLSAADRDYLLQVNDKDRLRSDDERLAAALFIHEGILTPSPENFIRPDEDIDHAQLVRLLARVARKARVSALVEAEIRDVTREGLLVREGEAERLYRLDPQLRLFRSLDGCCISVPELIVMAGEKVRLVTREDWVVFLEVEQSRLGASADRASRYHRWEKRLTPWEVGQGLKRHAEIGVVNDVQPRRLGVSGRVIELAVVGDKGVHVLKGLSIRWALGLRENLFVVERERDQSGRVRRFIFSGKGWGHGVGLCQIGAFGLARSGADYRAILEHYYSNVVIETIK